MLHILPTNYHLLAATPELYRNAYLSTKNSVEFSGGGGASGERASGQEKKRKKIRQRVTGLCRRVREEVVKFKLMTALRFQIGCKGGGRERETADIPSLPSGTMKVEKTCELLSVGAFPIRDDRA